MKGETIRKCIIERERENEKDMSIVSQLRGCGRIVCKPTAKIVEQLKHLGDLQSSFSQESII